jgi:uncharacterized protein (DUF3084 family)
MAADLTTTNVLLGIMAAVSVIEAAALIVAGILGMRMYRELRMQVDAIEQRHLAPITARIAPLIDRAAPLVDEAKMLASQASPVIEEAKVLMQRLQRTTEKVEHSMSRVDDAVQGTLDTAEQAVDKVQGGVRRTAVTAVGVVRGVRTAIETFLADQPNGARSPHTPPDTRTHTPGSPMA